MTDHRPGALHHALEPLARHGIDLNLLVSRPIPSRPFSYRFDAVLGGHPLDPEIAATLREMRDLTTQLRVFGSYRADGEPSASRQAVQEGFRRPLTRTARATADTDASCPAPVAPRGG